MYGLLVFIIPYYSSHTYLGGSINTGDEFSQMSTDQAVIQNPVLILHALKESVLSKVILVRFKLVVSSIALFVQAVDLIGKPSS